MNYIDLGLLATGLSMDAFAVSIAIGIAAKNISAKTLFLPPLFFGLFQMLMPLAGFEISAFAHDYIKDFDHWIAFFLLVFIGVKMICDAFKKDEEVPKTSSDLKLVTLLILAIATSIDALAAGISIACIGQKIFPAALIIGLTTFAFSLIGIKFGAKIGSKLGSKFDILGGAILIAIAFKVLFSA